MQRTMGHKSPISSSNMISFIGFLATSLVLLSKEANLSAMGIAKWHCFFSQDCIGSLITYRHLSGNASYCSVLLSSNFARVVCNSFSWFSVLFCTPSPICIVSGLTTICYQLKLVNCLCFSQLWWQALRTGVLPSKSSMSAMGMSSSSCIVSYALSRLSLTCKWYSFENTSHRHAFCSNGWIERSVSSSFYFIAFPLLCFRLRLSVSLVTISPFSTTSTEGSSLFTIFKTLNKRRMYM